MADLEIDIAAGRIRGTREGDVCAFHAVPYAAPPIGPLRFAAPQEPVPWSGVRDCTRPGPSAPQNGSRLDAVMGIAQFEQSEDCLYLDIWTPAADGARRPVLVWLHGGAYMSGGGSQPFYTGGRLAARGDMVVVSVTYRLGALGYLMLDGIEASGGAPTNRGLLDQCAALRFLRDNIARFGGDPDNVTVAGQSAGAGSVMALLAMPAARGLLHKGIVQSGPGLNHTEAEGREVADVFYAKAGLAKGDVEAVRAMDIATLLRLQHEVVVDYAGRPVRMIPWQPITGRPELPDMPMTVVAAGVAPEVPLMFGWTHDEMWAWYAQSPAMMNAPDLATLRKMPPAAGLDSAACTEIEAAIAKGAKPWEAFAAWQTLDVFGATATKTADTRASHGLPTWVYRFDWMPRPDARFRACHCIEIPFMFDNFADWPPSPMLEGANPAELKRVTAAVQDAWVSFARDGRPVVTGADEWPARSAERHALMVYDAQTRVEG